MRPKAVLVMSAASATVLVLAARSSQLPPVSLSTKGAAVVGASVVGQPPLPREAFAGQLPAPTSASPTTSPASTRIVSPRTSSSVVGRSKASHAAQTATSPPTTAPAAPTAPRPAQSSARQTPTPTRSAAPAKTVTVNGGAADTRYGPVQVQITLRSGHIVSARAIDYPQQSSQDQDINNRAIPQLNDEAVRADSAQIDTVSGASYTSQGYRQSLQSALDAAHSAGYR